MDTSRRKKPIGSKSRATKRVFFTIGYQGLTPKKFADLLRQNKVGLLIDIRQTAWSRIPGFSKTNLSSLLRRNGIDYSHEVELGTPKKIRDHYKKTRDLDVALELFRDHLRKDNRGLEKVKQSVNGHILCFMCMEEKSNECHRSIVADEFQKLTGWKAIHL